MNLAALLCNVEHTVVQNGVSQEISSVVIDSRKVVPGSMYVCIRGLCVDGHIFMQEAAMSGAAAILADSTTDYPPGVAIIKVPDSRRALHVIAGNFYGNPSSFMRMTGVTGTNGKTTTTYFLETILEEYGIKTGVIGTLGARVGDMPVEIPYSTASTPDVLELNEILSAMREMGAKDVVMEVSSHALALNKVDSIQFETGIFTNITPDHMDFHITMENYREAKSRLFDLCKHGVINADDPSAGLIMHGKYCNFATYGLESDCTYKAINNKYMPDGSSFDIDIGGMRENFFLPVKGRFNVYNCLAAISAAITLGIPVEAIKKGVSNIRGIPGRIQAIPNDFGAHIFIDYAHTPDGLVSIINAVREFTKGRLITLFGCGGDKDKTKRPVMGRLAGELSDYVILTSDNPRSECPEEIIKEITYGIKETNCPFEVYTDRKEAIFEGISMLGEEDALIIAGKGHEKKQIIGDRSFPFNDADVTMEALASRSGL